MFNVLLQVLDDGRLTDGQGRVVSFKNAIIIMTSNIGSQLIRERDKEETMGDMVEDMQKMTPEAAAKRMAEFANRMQDALRNTFRPEFLNRIDDIITFNELNIASIEPIVELQLAEVSARLKDRKIELEITPAAKERLAIDGYDPVYGARPLKRLIQRQVVDRVATGIIEGRIYDGSTVTIDIDAEGNYDAQADNHGKDVDLPDGAAELLEEANSFLNEVEGEE